MNKKLNIAIFWLWHVCLLFCTSGCDLLLKTKDCTQLILPKDRLPSIHSSAIAIVPPYTFSAFVDQEEIWNLHDSLFEAHIKKYRRNQISENKYALKSYRDYYKFFGNRVNSYLVAINVNDRDFIQAQLKKMEKDLKDSSYKKYIIPKEMLATLSKYPETNYLLTDITEYYSYWIKFKGYGFSNYCLVRCFLIDGKTGELVFYNYQIQQNRFLPLSPIPRVKPVLRKLRKKFPASESLTPYYTW